jgi:hypothetical protein
MTTIDKIWKQNEKTIKEPTSLNSLDGQNILREQIFKLNNIKSEKPEVNISEPEVDQPELKIQKLS